MKMRCLGCMEEYDGQFEVCPFCGYIQGTPAKEAYHIAPGTVIKKRYLIGRVLGSGGFGITYIGYDQILEKKVAVKEYLPTEFATRMPNQTNVTVYAGDKREQFLAGMNKSLDEAKRLAEFQQTAGITQVYDFFEENNTAYIVMELLDGETLKDKLKRDGKMTVEEALPIVLAVIGALKEVHAKNMIHRDIAPDNIYLLKNGEVKLLDFGASRQVTTTHSKSLTVILKLGYAPVEQYQSGGNQGPWTDVYALAATFYKMITGVRPQESPERRMKDTLKEPSRLGVKIDKNVENALMNALQVRIEDRTKSAEEFEQALYSPDVERTKATEEKNDTGRWPFWLKGVCIAAGATIIAVGGLMAAGVFDLALPTLPAFEENGVMVPSLINMSQDAARQRLEERGLTFSYGGMQASDTIMEGYVLGQNDENGQKLNPGDFVEPGSVVKVIVSSGTGKATVPDVLWMEQQEAEAYLKELGLLGINVESDAETWAAKGTVTGVEPEMGSEILLEDTMILKIADGSSQPAVGETVVPEVTGLSQEKAYEQLKDQGLFLEKQELQYSISIPKGQVISQSIAAGQSVLCGEIVRVAISAGPRQIQLPSVINMAEAEARTNLENLGLAVTVQREYSDSTEAGMVIAQSVAPGTVSEGTEIVMTVSQGAKPEETTAGGRRVNESGRGAVSQPQETQTQPPIPQTQAPETQPSQTAQPETRDSQTDW